MLKSKQSFIKDLKQLMRIAIIGSVLKSGLSLLKDTRLEESREERSLWKKMMIV